MKPHVLFLVLTVIALNRFVGIKQPQRRGLTKSIFRSITARTSDGEAWQRYLSRHK